MRKLTIFAIMAFSVLPAWAQAPCNATPKLNVANYPGVKSVPSTNNLLRPTGKPMDSEGQRLILMGRVLDKKCMPIPGVVVEIWQTDPFGKWSIADAGERATPNAVFAGAGRSYTNSEGEFTFITAFPAPMKDRAPFINLRVAPEQGASFTTSLFFAEDARNTKDPVLKKMKPEESARVMLKMQPLSNDPRDGNYGNIDIILPNVMSTLRY